MRYALTSVYTNQYLGGADGPSLLTADPITAAHTFLATDRIGHLEVMAHATAPDGTLMPVRPGEIVERALAELPADDPRHGTLCTAQADWLEDRLWDREDEPFASAPAGPDWHRAGAAWGAEFTALPGDGVLTELAARYPGTELSHVPLVTAALRTVRAIRQATGPVRRQDRQALAANWRILSPARPGHTEPAVLAAAAWYLERLADLDPLTARPPAHLTDAQRSQWREAAVDLQRDLLVLVPERHPARIETFTALTYAEPADPAPHSDAPTEESDRRRVEAALVGALDHLPLDGEVRARVRAAAAGVLQPPQPLPIPDQPAQDADAALHWRRRVPSAQRAAEDNDATLTNAYTYVAHAQREIDHGVRPAGSQGTTVLAANLAAETTGRHAVLGRLLALADAERTATAHEPHLHKLADTAAQAARAAAQDQALRPMEAHYAAQAAYTVTFDAARSLLDEDLAQQRRTVRATVAAHFPRPGHRLGDQLAAGIDQEAVARARNAVAVLTRALDDLLAADRNPRAGLAPTAEQISEARSRADAARQRFNEITGTDRPATLEALRALRAVMDLPEPPPPGDGDGRLARHRRQLTERLTATGPAAATTTPGPRPARNLPRQEPRPATVKRGMR
ncbi:hypothetical protein PUR61_08430 [Streptomyces sp. BE20]|uniref:hypothetical protein n=1 Tax=Streptomyces sp. BE20 TaxID=3002525 RepID=UPI002E79442F|nr:hypothetical protein [Streptomyces sp. BE20]MEE1822220.1 hypothetical protein [Streptomyces sp. BE20]